MLRPIKHLRPAMEAIAFQSGAFFKELKMLFEPFCNKGKVPTKEELLDLSVKLDNAVFQHTGITSNIEFNFHASCCQIPDLSANNVTLMHLRGLLSSRVSHKFMTRRDVEQIVGSVDLKNSKISGALSKFELWINLDCDHFLADNMTAGEFSSVLMHEVGHYFTYCELMTRTVHTNQVLAGLEQQLRGGDAKEFHITIKKAAGALDLDKSVVESLNNISDERVAMTVLATASIRQARVTSDTGMYEFTTSEMAADQFVARHGAGRELATALDKVYKSYGKTFNNNKVNHIAVQAVKAAAVLTVGIGSIALAATGLLPAIIFPILLFGHLMSSVELPVSGSGIYDTPRYRTARLKQQLIEYSKDPKISAVVARKIIRDVEVLDNLIESMTEYESWFSIVARMLNAPGTKAYKDIRFQQELEALAANSLFVKSLELKHL